MTHTADNIRQRIPTFLACCIVFLATACEGASANKRTSGKHSAHSVLAGDDAAQTLSPEQEGSAKAEDRSAHIDSLMQAGIPEFGYRFQVTGDFDGNGKDETLTEHYFSRKTGREAIKYYELDGYGEDVEIAVYQQPYSFVTASDKQMDTLRISKESQLFGLRFLKNEGDLDGDGGDELSYVVSWADFSSGNTWNIASYKKGKWEIVYSFAIRETELPYLPNYYDADHTFLNTGKVTIPASDTSALRMEKELLEFKGLVQKTGDKTIRIEYLNSAYEEVTKVVKLK